MAHDLEALIYKCKEGSTKGYDAFVSAISDPSVQDEKLYKYLKSLRSCVTLLNKDHEMLVGIILNLDWPSRDKKVVDAYQSLILNLISVHTDYLKACLRKIIKSFTPPVAAEDKESGSVCEGAVQKHNHMFLHLHTLLRTIIQIVPMSSRVLMPLLTDMCPFINKDVYIHECYIRNMFQITYYTPTLRQPILELAIQTLIKLDVRAPRAKIMETKSADTDISDESGIFNMEDVNIGLKEADTLDVLMCHLLQYIHTTCYKDDKLQWDETKKLYREMLYVFEKVILPTHACCHVQFVMFYITSFKQELCDGFLDYLWKYVQNPNLQAVYRQLAVSYMASLLARGNFVSVNTMMRTIDLMMKWVHTYTQTCNDCVMADVTHHGPFYSVCQAVFYTFAFRQKDIFEQKKGLKWAESLQFEHLVHNRLNPLKVCFPIIVKTFASITRQHQLAFCDSIIQHNSRSFLPVVSNGTQRILESYFPFDPYLLKRSCHYIEPHYREYDQIVEVNDDNSQSDEEDDDEMFTEDVTTTKSIAMATMSGSLVDKSPLDLMSYGTSPGFKHL